MWELMLYLSARIFDRLKDVGWHDEAKELHDRYDLRCDRFIAKLQPLTDEGAPRGLYSPCHGNTHIQS